MSTRETPFSFTLFACLLIIFSKTTMPKIYIAAEHCGFNLKKYLIQNSEFAITDLYLVEDPNDDYPDVAELMILKLAEETEAFGILICGSGQGIAIAANRSHFVRCVTPRNVLEAKATRDHNNANCLSFGAAYTKPEEALKILQAFVSTDFSNEERHRRRVKKLGQKK
jgi:ribose 5-phosphate isomerase B